MQPFLFSCIEMDCFYSAALEDLYAFVNSQNRTVSCSAGLCSLLWPELERRAGHDWMRHVLRVAI